MMQSDGRPVESLSPQHIDGSVVGSLTPSINNSALADCVALLIASNCPFQKIKPSSLVGTLRPRMREYN